MTFNDRDLPPHYNTGPRPQCPNLPLYTESPGHSELRVLNSVPSSPTDVPRARTRQGVYQTDHLDVDLGEFPWALMYPAYGFNGVVEGVITFRKKCSYVTQVTVKLEGQITANASEYATVAVHALANMCLVNKTVTLFSLPDTQDHRAIAAGTQYRFSIPFPTYINGQHTRLPPSYTAIHPGATTEIGYALQVDVTRKGLLRRNEVRRIPVLYLPRTRPSLPALLELPPLSGDLHSDNVKVVELSRVWPETCQAQNLTSRGTDLPTMQAFLPISRCYASGEPIPLAVKISSPTSPALTKIYAADLEVQLLKRRKVYVGPNRQLNKRENILSTAIQDQATCPSHGECCMILRLEAGVAGKESSWAVEGLIEIQYVIRIIVRPPKDLPHLPVFRHDELVELTSDPYESLETELLTGTLREPALGLTTLRTGSESIHSNASV